MLTFYLMLISILAFLLSTYAIVLWFILIFICVVKDWMAIDLHLITRSLYVLPLFHFSFFHSILSIGSAGTYKEEGVHWLNVLSVESVAVDFIAWLVKSSLIVSLKRKIDRKKGWFRISASLCCRLLNWSTRFSIGREQVSVCFFTSKDLLDRSPRLGRACKFQLERRPWRNFW